MKHAWYSFLLETELTTGLQGHNVAGRIMSIKNLNVPIENNPRTFGLKRSAKAYSLLINGSTNFISKSLYFKAEQSISHCQVWLPVIQVPQSLGGLLINYSQEK
jgi:hypothetical protein